MAIRHGLSGQYGKAQARKRLVGSFLFLVIGVALGIGAVFFAWGYFWSQHGDLYGLFALIVMVALVVASWRWIGKTFDASGKERIKYMRGGQSEAYVAWILEDLDDDWHIFNGIQLELESDTDHVVVGPGGVFCISTKSHRGWFVGTPDGLLHNGRPCGFAKDALRQAMNLVERLKAALGADVPWVQAVLALPFGYIDNDACGGKVWLAHADNLADRLAPEGGPRKLKPKQVERVVKVMEMIAASAAEIYRRPEATKIASSATDKAGA